MEANGAALDGFDRELTIAERLLEVGYTTAQFGKWHLRSGPNITEHGFKHVFAQNSQAAFSANITLSGQDREMSNLPAEMYHVDGCSRAAASLIERYRDEPFIETNAGDLDGVNLIPHLTGQVDSPPHATLTWRWTDQSAIREENWKLLRGGDREYLYDLDADLEEKHNLASKHPKIATRLREGLVAWAETLDPPGLAKGGMSLAATNYFDFYLDGKPATPLRETSVPKTSESPIFKGGIARNGELSIQDDALRLSGGDEKSKAAFLARSQISLLGPVSVSLQLKTITSGKATIAWRTSAQKDFEPGSEVVFDVAESDDWQTHTVNLPV